MFREGSQIGSYTLIRKLGRGGFGEVWLAEKRSQFVTKKVAVKLPHEEQVNFDAIRQEATLWEQASGHPNVLPIIDADVYDGQVVIVSEYADGGSLADRLQREGKLPLQAAVEMTIGVLNGLDYLHRKKIIHRDIKPQNILLQDGTPRLADFGISRAMQTTAISSKIIGTDAYMPPEAFQGKRNVQTDIWSVGVVLYALLADNLPFQQEHPSERMYAILMTEPEPLSNEIPHRLREIVQKALAKQPEDRYQSAVEMREDLQKVLININHPTFAPTEILHQPFVGETESLMNQADVPIVQTNAPSIQTEIQPPQPEKETEQFTRPAIETNHPSEAPSLVTQIKPAQTDESAKPLPTVAQAFADRKYNSRDNNRILYYAGAGVLGLLLLLGAFVAIYFLSGSKPVERSANSNKAENLQSNMATNSLPADDVLIPYRKGDKWGFADRNKKIVIEPKFNNAYQFSEGLAAVESPDGDGYGYIDETGKLVVPYKYHYAELFKEGLACVRYGGDWGFIDKRGNEVVALGKYNDVYDFSEGLAVVQCKPADRYGFIDKTGNMMFPCKAQNATEFSEGLAGVEISDKYGFIDNTGKMVIQPKYDVARLFSEGLVAVSVTEEGKWGFIDKNLNEIIPPKYEDAFKFTEGLATVKLNDKYGFIDKNGNEIISFRFQGPSYFSEGLAGVKLNGKLGFIDKTGKEVIPFKYDFGNEYQFFSFNDGLVRVDLGGKEFYIDKNGTEYYEP